MDKYNFALKFIKLVFATNLCITGKLESPFRRTVSVPEQIYVDGQNEFLACFVYQMVRHYWHNDFDGHGDGDVTCKQTFIQC